MRRYLIILVGLLLLVPASASAHSQGPIKDSYQCIDSFANYTGCAHIHNNIKTFTAPGKTDLGPPLVFAAFQDVWGLWSAQKTILAGKSGDAIVGGKLNADGAMIYSYRATDRLPQNYQALIGFRLSSGDGLEGCIVMSYLDCKKGPQLETGRDSKHTYTITSRPLEVRIVNLLPQAIKRVDGPYWSNALAIRAADNAGRIEPTKTGTAGALRSVLRTSAYAAVYKFVRSTGDVRFNGSTIAISIRVDADGTKNSQCTPIYPPSGTRFQCTVNIGESEGPSVIATIRVQQN